MYIYISKFIGKGGREEAGGKKERRERGKERRKERKKKGKKQASNGKAKRQT